MKANFKTVFSTKILKDNDKTEQNLYKKKQF